ncbi:bifunctional acetate--CoA ligase family protein/GNAT family N-acetyltransferase [Stappia indica]|uniref:bifunctional acetate--CoA ligase family protein/GNAT family N-acetyltransferase n=1 Tax=Stappia indica TaxID=538381 RepID=UPI001CD255A3|nr:bifunctional acetate--CoA ligase family protein/GNAT family N-acetyltransferase [Stappia indica]MCA1297668.1 bifunctional acetate--CoA ligase family protein/GNAT family N-acetyltransferase [Stappia indica]
MTIRNLEGLFRPTSLAVVGPCRLGQPAFDLLLSRLQEAGFAGPKTVIGCGKDLPEGFRPKRRLADLDTPPDLMLLVGPPEDAPELIRAAGDAGTRAAIALSPGYDRWDDDLVTRTLQAARPNTLRLLGPGSLGVAAPAGKLAGHLGISPAAAGDLAFIARSGTVINATLSWAQSNGIGFSGIASLGQRTDVDASDLLDWFALDYKTRAILVHLETVANPRKFLSAARAAARTKPVVILRSGASREPAGVGTTHAGRIAVSDRVFDAALARAGVLRVQDIDEMFEAVETVSRLKPVAGHRLGIVATGGSLATLAADQLEQQGGTLAQLSEETTAKVAPLQRAGQSTCNPVTLHETSPPEAYVEAVTTLLGDRGVDAVLAVIGPSAFSHLQPTADALAAAYRAYRPAYGRRKPLLVALAAGAPLPRQALDNARIPCHGSASEAVRAFMHLVRYAEARELLMAAPPSLPSSFSPLAETARALVHSALAQGRSALTPAEVRTILQAYDIPQVPSTIASTPADAADAARELLQQHERLALKLTSPQLPFKSDVGGVILDLKSPEEVERAAGDLIDRITAAHPDADITGIVLQPMMRHQHASEVFIGLADDATFGPVILFGSGGTAVEVTGDVAMALPPLDLNLAEELIGRTRISRLLDGFRNRPKSDLHAIALTLVKVAQIAVDVPEIREMDINPLLTDHTGVLALDARITIAPATVHPGRRATSRLAIAPYPKEWERHLTLKDGSEVFVRPVRPEDEEPYRQFFQKVSPEDLRLRFFAPVKEFNHAFMARLVQLDYSRAIAFVASDPQSEEILGVVRLHADPDHRTGEYAILVQSTLKGRGLGWVLMQLIIDYAVADGIETIKGEVLKENTTMLAMCKGLGFSVKSSLDDDAIAVVTLPVAEIRQRRG